MIGLEGRIDLEMPIMTKIIDKLLGDFKDSFIGCLSLVISLREVWAREIVMDVDSSPYIIHMLFFKRCSMICEDGGRDVEVVDDMVEDELGYLNTFSEDEKNHFNPLCEIFNGCYDIFVSI